MEALLNQARELKLTKNQQWKLGLLEQVKAHAEANYENGWDTIVECFSDKDILDLVGSAYTLNTWIARLQKFVDDRAEALSNCY